MATVNLLQNEAIGTFYIVELFLDTPQSIIDEKVVENRRQDGRRGIFSMKKNMEIDGVSVCRHCETTSIYNYKPDFKFEALWHLTKCYASEALYTYNLSYG